MKEIKSYLIKQVKFYLSLKTSYFIIFMMLNSYLLGGPISQKQYESYLQQYFIQSVELGNLKKVTQALALKDEFGNPKVNINHTYANSYTPLTYASKKNHPAIIDALLQAGADVNKPNKYGITPLILAMHTRNIDTITKLLNAGADPNQKDRCGWTPLMEAIILDSVDIVKALLWEGAHVTRSVKNQVYKNSDISQIILNPDKYRKPNAEHVAINMHGQKSHDNSTTSTYGYEL